MNAVVEHVPQQQSLLVKFAAKFSVEPKTMLQSLKSTAFRQRGNEEVTNEQMVSLLVVATEHGLNPFLKEIYAYPDKGGIVPVVGIDGWSRLINEHPQFDGMAFTYDEDSCTCTIYRKDRSHPMVVTEFISECKRDTDPWKRSPRRMIRHRAMIQCARIAFGFTKIKDPDEAERIVDMGAAQVLDPAPAVANINDSIRQRRTQATDIASQEPPQGASPAPEAPTQPAEPASASAADPAAPGFTFAQVASSINKATDLDTLAVAADLIGEVADATHRGELRTLYEQRKAKLGAQ